MAEFRLPICSTESVGEESMAADANHFTFIVKRVAESRDVDPHFTMPAHSLTVTPDGHLNIHGRYQSRTFSHGAWDTFEVKLISPKRS
jgi:hypothetical protein